SVLVLEQIVNSDFVVCFHLACRKSRPNLFSYEKKIWRSVFPSLITRAQPSVLDDLIASMPTLINHLRRWTTVVPWSSAACLTSANTASGITKWYRFFSGVLCC